ncbi:MAG: hypothetical protein SF028_11270 [Candidatus Sumerlaeia bacterium]|nr:hypothetical protein [Candidatus Sumerlaeia bacterium]
MKYAIVALIILNLVLMGGAAFRISTAPDLPPSTYVPPPPPPPAAAEETAARPAATPPAAPQGRGAAALDAMAGQGGRPNEVDVDINDPNALEDQQKADFEDGKAHIRKLPLVGSKKDG